MLHSRKCQSEHRRPWKLKVKTIIIWICLEYLLKKKMKTITQNSKSISITTYVESRESLEIQEKKFFFKSSVGERLQWQREAVILFKLNALYVYKGYPGSSNGKELPEMWETQVWFLDWEVPLEEGMATHSSILAWRIPWTEEPGGLWSMGSQRVGHYWVTNFITFIIACD